ncbi:MAG: hypothetical protein QOI42_1038 [Frankiaceae bacterium]|nr:hypothetical protein [Frankiaceae bacterium]
MGIRGSFFARVAMVVSLGVGVLAAGPAQAATACPTVNGVVYHTCVTSVTLSRSTASVSGDATVPLTATIGIHSDPGVPTGRATQSSGAGEPRDRFPELYFNIAAFGQSTLDRVGLTLASGDVHDGLWQATINITVLDAGAMTTSVVSFGGLGSPPMSNQSIPAALRRSVSVTAAHVPMLTSSVDPSTVHYNDPLVVNGHVADPATRLPMARITVHVQQPSQWCECYLTDQSATTDASGNWSLRIANFRGAYLRVAILAPANSDGRKRAIKEVVDAPDVLGVVTAGSSAATLARGQAVQITGSAGPVAGQSMILEKWVNHSWSAVAHAALRPSGRFTFSTVPSSTGHWAYRVRDSSFHVASPAVYLSVS